MTLHQLLQPRLLPIPNNTFVTSKPDDGLSFRCFKNALNYIIGDIQYRDESQSSDNMADVERAKYIGFYNAFFGFPSPLYNDSYLFATSRIPAAYINGTYNGFPGATDLDELTAKWTCNRGLGMEPGWWLLFALLLLVGY